MRRIATLPEKYIGMLEEELHARALSAKKKLGDRLCILGHYYQRSEVIQFADKEGDSFALAKMGSEVSAEFIVFCGVHFMAESSVVLAKKDQRVFLPDMDAGCPLADFAVQEQVERAWRELENLGVAADFIPIVYMNSSADVKAFAGRNGGIVCTSSSAGRALSWVRAQGKKAFFLPDKNLCLNTCHTLSIPTREIFVWDQYESNGGLSANDISSASVIAWNGYCHVHTLFTVEHVKNALVKYPSAKIIVHPECDPEVVDVSDASGSTAFIKEYVEDARRDSTIVIGTEINFISRLAKNNPDKKIVPLARSLCPNMFRTSLADLVWTLEEIGEVNEVFVSEKTAKDARLALERMLKI